MEHTSTESVVRDSRGETFVCCGEEWTAEEFTNMHHHLFENVSEYVRQNPQSTNTQLFSFLTLLNAYIPESYLLMPECLQILGPPDPIHGGPPFEERMEPFTDFINASSSNPEHVCVIHPVVAQRAVEILAHLGISRSSTVKKFMELCGQQTQPHIIQFITDLLTKRKLGGSVKKKFSQLIHDILWQEKFSHAVSVLKTASDKFRKNPIFPQTIARLYYMNCMTCEWHERSTYSRIAEEWAKKAIRRAPNNSYVADTLGQVCKSRLRQAGQREDILKVREKSFRAFKDVERKAEKEEGPEMDNTAGTESISDSFNNRGLFGFIQVAKIAFEKFWAFHPQEHRNFIKSLESEVEAKFDFFEWYLTYSKPDKATLEPHYFWGDIVRCYKYYTTNTASRSTSFPGLLDYLNHGLFMSKGRRAGFEEAEETVSDLQTIRDSLKATYEANVDDVDAAKRYILSNIILSNKMRDSPDVTPVRELQTIIHRFLGAEVGRRSPEFYLLVLLLFWPEEQPQTVQEEDDEDVEQQTTEDDGSEDTTWEDEDRDEEQETRGETAQLSSELMFDLDLQQQVTFMRKAFGRAKYAKYLRGRYLLPLFFLGKGSGLSKWIHKSRLDAILEEMVHAEKAVTTSERILIERKISKMWMNGQVWQVPKIQDILLPVQVSHPPMAQEALVCIGGMNITATAEAKPEGRPSPVRFYLGFTIQGPVVFPHSSGQ